MGGPGRRASIVAVALVLLVEDDAAIAEPLVRTLRRAGHDVESVADGVTAAARGMAGGHDLVILDLGLPGLDGLEVCRRIRAVRAAVPILILTARAEEIDAIVGLDSGADDYQAKPFRRDELMARVRALLRRGAPSLVGAGGVRVDPAARRAWVGERELALSPRGIRPAHPAGGRGRQRRSPRTPHGRGLGHQLVRVRTKTLDVHVSSLRRKLGDDPRRPRLLITVRGVGFRFEAA